MKMRKFSKIVRLTFEALLECDDEWSIECRKTYLKSKRSFPSPKKVKRIAEAASKSVVGAALALPPEDHLAALEVIIKEACISHMKMKMLDLGIGMIRLRRYSHGSKN